MTHPLQGLHVTFMLLRSALLPLGLALLAGCTTYTYEDGSQETLWGVPTEEETRRYEEDRQAEGVRYRIPGQVEPERNDPISDSDPIRDDDSITDDGVTPR